MGRRIDWRVVASAVLGGLAVITVLLAVIGLWGRATVFDGDRAADLAVRVVDDPAVRASLASVATEQALAAVDLEGRLERRFGERAAVIVDPLTARLRSGLEDRIEELLAHDTTRALVRTNARRAHAKVVEVLHGDGPVDGLTLEDDAATLDVLPVLSRGVAWAEGVGLLDVDSLGDLAEIDLGDIDAGVLADIIGLDSGAPSVVEPSEVADDRDRAQLIEAIETALDRELPEDFGLVVVYRSDSVADAGHWLATAQRVLVLTDRTLWVLLVLSVVFPAASLGLARRRGRAAMLLGLGIAALALVARVLPSGVVDQAPGMVTRPGSKAAVAIVSTDLADSLLRTLTWVTLAGLLLAAIASVIPILARRRDPEP